MKTTTKELAVIVVAIVIIAVAYLAEPHYETLTFFAGQNVSGFMIQAVNPNNVTGRYLPIGPALYGPNQTLQIGDSVGGDPCNGPLATLVAIKGNAAIFKVNTTWPAGICSVV